METTSQNTILLNRSLEEEYNQLLKSSEKVISVKKQWSRPGDVIQKFTLYENYTPVKTSSNTTLLKKL